MFGIHKNILIIFCWLLFAVDGLAAVHEVKIQFFEFTPNLVEVAVGDTIHFVSLDRAAHQVVSDPNKEEEFPASPVLNKNGEFSLLIGEGNDFLIKCGLHETMPGLDVVVIN